MRYARLLLLITGCLFLAGAAQAQTSAELKRRKDALSREIEQLNSTLNETSSSKRLSLKQISTLNAQIRLRERKINTMNSEIRLLDNQISDNTSTVRALQTQLTRLKKEYAGMVLFAFRNQSAYSKIMFLFASKDFNQGYKRLKYLQEFAAYRQKQARYIEETRGDLNEKIIELGHNKDEKSHILSDQEQERQTLGKQKSTQAKVLKSLTKQEKEYKQELAQKQRESARLNRAVMDAIRREIEEAQRAADANAVKNGNAPAPRTSTKTSILAATPESAKLSSDFLGSRGNLPWPVEKGAIAEGFGIHKYGVNVNVENLGIDIETGAGSTVRAVFSGTVGRITNLNGSQTVIIRHGEYFSVYSNLRGVTVTSGQKINTKQPIGTVATNSEDGTIRLHFEIYKGLSPQNPENWLAN
ncbi:murein hydrolase activator EnvC family protein [Hufsiella ginkgonis]|uniref:Peptidoglycan DD-metalloendopeptidase family protein n=1 Tax=Hufsiella ginkgonis TaxID=2695274 RepID=A0A7K1Y3X8_9SPHI|nr:peptidoglycan DD-metalloendopeptidase family protein [Hufsiella ginkgonis]MXV17942.1 peptidoglycan DD-metalloendopeptidase family protein [Hufsiella ginkgonis]